jgi:hypothetical protein
MNQQQGSWRDVSAEAPQSNGTHPPEGAGHLEQALLGHATQVLQSLAQYLGSVSPQRLLSDSQELLRRQPALAWGGAFLLGVTAAHVLQRPSGQQPATGTEPHSDRPATAPRARDQHGASREVASEEGVAPHSWPATAPVAHGAESSDTPPVGSPIGDAPYAGGSSH